MTHVPPGGKPGSYKQQQHAMVQQQHPSSVASVAAQQQQNILQQSLQKGMFFKTELSQVEREHFGSSRRPG